MSTVTIYIKNTSKSIQIPWHTDLNIQEALEIAYDQEKLAGRPFNFALKYYEYLGQDYLGYLVVMIDKLYDNPIDPNDYWLFYVNGIMAQVGIDSYMLNIGDLIEFDYLPSTPAIRESFQYKLKHEFNSTK